MQRVLCRAVLMCALGTMATSAAVAGDGLSCSQVFGPVSLVDDPQCQIAQKYPGPHYVMAPQSCFQVKLWGLGHGFAGLTQEATVDANGGQASTPLAILESGATSSANLSQPPRTFITGRSYIKNSAGAVYTADAGIVGPGGAAEQIVILKGDGKYQGAKGTLYVSGNYVGGGTGFYHGQICIKN